jgi:heptosyltransferase II
LPWEIKYHPLSRVKYIAWRIREIWWSGRAVPARKQVRDVADEPARRDARRIYDWRFAGGKLIGQGRLFVPLVDWASRRAARQLACNRGQSRDASACFPPAKKADICGATGRIKKVMTETLTLNRNSPAPNGRVMLCNIGRLGDTILRNSILDSVFQTYATVDYICGPGNEELLRSESRINEITMFQNSLRGFARLLKTALRNRYDGYIGLKDHRSWTSVLIAQLFRSRVKTGWNSDFLRPFHRDVRGVCSSGLHQTQTMRRVGELAGLEPGEYKPSLALSADSIQWFRQNHEWERPFIFLNISATGADRRWPVEQWARYVRGCGLGGECILVNGLSADRSLVDELCRKLPGAAAFQPRNFMDVAAAVSNAWLVLTVDTGVVHACSALNTPIVALYSGEQHVTINGPLSTQRLVIKTRGKVADMSSEEAIAETLRQGLPASNHSSTAKAR